MEIAKKNLGTTIKQQIQLQKDILRALQNLFSLSHEQLTTLNTVESKILQPYKETKNYFKEYFENIYPKSYQFLNTGINKFKEDASLGTQQVFLLGSEIPDVVRYSVDGIKQRLTGQDTLTEHEKNILLHSQEAIVNGSKLAILFVLGHSGGFISIEYAMRPGAGLLYTLLLPLGKNNPFALKFHQYGKRNDLPNGSSQQGSTGPMEFLDKSE